jgi:transcription elongation factor GreA
LLDFLNARRRAAAEETPIATEEAEVEAEMDAGMTGEPAFVQPVIEIRAVDEDEELYVEVGDTITYCDVETPDERKQVLITDGPSKFEQGIINAATPLARTLLDKAEGEEVNLILPGRGPKRFRVLRIERNNRQRPV